MTKYLLSVYDIGYVVEDTDIDKIVLKLENSVNNVQLGCRRRRPELRKIRNWNVNRQKGYWALEVVEGMEE